MWTLAAVAVRVARGLSLHLQPNATAGQSETFFDQQMRSRLWLTVCLIDMQSVFIQATEPLISQDEVAAALAQVRHVNDSDLNRTTGPLPNKEGLTDMTFAFVTYHLQLAGRQLNFQERSDDSTSTATDWDRRQKHAQQFESSALQLLHFCDPEASNQAWFTWHGTQCLVSGIRLSVLRPLHGRGIPPPRMGSDGELLRVALSVLEKTQLMHTDPRGEGFRWYITIPWHVVAIAIAECYVCTDVGLIRRAWPVVEACYRQHEAIIAKYSGGILQGPLGKLMRRTRQKLATLLESDDGVEVVGRSGSNDMDLSSAVVAPIFEERSQDLFTLQDAQNTWVSTSFPLPSHTTATTDMPDLIADTQDMTDQSWRVWEEFVSEIPWEEV